MGVTARPGRNQNTVEDCMTEQLKPCPFCGEQQDGGAGMSAPERIWVDDDGYWFDIDPSETRPEYIRKDASDAAIAAARAEGVREGMLGLLEDDNLRFVIGQRI